MEGIKRLYRNSLYTFKGLFGWLDPTSYTLIKVINPIFQVIFFALVARHAYGDADITPYIIGNALILVGYNAFFGVGSIMVAERHMGTLKTLVASPSEKCHIFLGKVIFYTVDGLVSVGVGLLTGILVFGVRIPKQSIGLVGLIVLVTMFTACAMGLLIGCVGMAINDINMIANITSMAIMALSGVNFSVELLPKAVQYISNLLPLTHALKAIRGIIGITPLTTGEIYTYIGIEAAVGLSYGVVAYLLFKVIERIARVRGTIDIY